MLIVLEAKSTSVNLSAGEARANAMPIETVFSPPLQGLVRWRVLTDHDFTVVNAMLDHACPLGALAFSTTYDWLHKVTDKCPADCGQSDRPPRPFRPGASASQRAGREWPLAAEPQPQASLRHRQIPQF